MKSYTMTLDKFLVTFKGYESDDLDFTSKEREECMNDFKEFASTFCDKKNLLDNGTYTFVSCDGENFIYTVN